VDLQGNVQWESDRKFQMGSILIADGRLFVLDGSNGDLFMVQATSERYNVLGRATGMLSGREVWAQMAYSDGRLLLRDHDELVCLQVK
jgi:hypothetical protein